VQYHYCVWCDHRIRHNAAEQDGRPYHEICVAMRELGITPEPEVPPPPSGERLPLATADRRMDLSVRRPR
jgi:hypothetical protein